MPHDTIRHDHLLGSTTPTIKNGSLGEHNNHCQGAQHSPLEHNIHQGARYHGAQPPHWGAPPSGGRASQNTTISGSTTSTSREHHTHQQGAQPLGEHNTPTSNTRWEEPT